MGEFTNLLGAKTKYYDGPPRALDPTFGVAYFDGTRETGCGGYHYLPGFWKATVERILKRYDLGPGSRLLDIGCAKGFFLADLLSECPGIEIQGIDISAYAIANTQETVKPFVSVGSADDLSRFPDHSFDFVAAMNTLHFLTPPRALQALREILRVGKGRYFVQVDSFNNETERERMLAWAPTIKTVYSPQEWLKMFEEASYTGDYYWTIAQHTPQTPTPETS